MPRGSMARDGAGSVGPEENSGRDALDSAPGTGKPAPSSPKARAKAVKVTKSLKLTRLVDSVTDAYLHGIYGLQSVSPTEAELGAVLTKFGAKSISGARFLLGVLSPPDKLSADLVWTRARFSALSQRTLYFQMYLEKMERGEDCPYDKELLLALCKGMGLLVDTRPVDNDSRRKEDEKVAEAVMMDRVQLADRVLARLNEGNAAS